MTQGGVVAASSSLDPKSSRGLRSPRSPPTHQGLLGHRELAHRGVVAGRLLQGRPQGVQRPLARLDGGTGEAGTALAPQPVPPTAPPYPLPFPITRIRPSCIPRPPPRAQAKLPNPPTRAPAHQDQEARTPGASSPGGRDRARPPASPASRLPGRGCTSPARSGRAPAAPGTPPPGPERRLLGGAGRERRPGAAPAATAAAARVPWRGRSRRPGRTDRRTRGPTDRAAQPAARGADVPPPAPGAAGRGPMDAGPVRLRTRLFTRSTWAAPAVQESLCQSARGRRGRGKRRRGREGKEGGGWLPCSLAADRSVCGLVARPAAVLE